MDTTAEVGYSLDKKEMVVLISPEECKNIWHQLLPLFIKGEVSWVPFMDLSDIKKAIIKEQFQLWVLIIKEEYKAVLLTEIAEYPRAKILRFIHVSGEGIFQGLSEKIQVCIDWGRRQGATAYQIYGSRAWLKLLSTNNEPDYKVVFYKEIGEAL